MDYNFTNAEDATIENEGMLFGIEWYDDEGELIGTDWYESEEERLNAVDVWYADTQDTTPEQ